MAFRSLEQFLTTAIFVLEAQSYIFVPFHNQPHREKQSHKTALLEKKILKSRGRGQCPTIIIYLSVIYIQFLLTIFRTVTDNYIHKLK